MSPELVVPGTTGRYERPAASAKFAASGIAVAAVVNPRQARDVRGSVTGRLAKTDETDAHILALSALV